MNSKTRKIKRRLEMKDDGIRKGCFFIILITGLTFSFSKPVTIDVTATPTNVDQDKATLYKQHVARGDSLFDLQEYSAAMKEFQKAAEIMPYEEYPRLQMQVIETTLGVKSLENKKKESAKPAEDEPAEKSSVESTSEKEITQEVVATETATETQPKNQDESKSIIESYQDTLAMLDDKEDRIEKSIVYAEIASKLKEADQHAKALEYLQKSLMIEEEQDNKPNVANLYDGMGDVYLDSGEVESSIDHYEKSIEVKNEIGDKKGVSEGYSKIGNVYEKTYDYQSALDYYEKSAEVKGELDDKAGLSTVMDNMGNIYYKQKFLEKSIDSYKKAAELNEQLGNEDELGSTYNKMGVAYYELGQFENAEQFMEKSVEIKEKNGNQKEASMALNNLGNLNYNQNKIRKAISYYEKSLDYKTTSNYEAGKAISLFNLGKAYREMDDNDKAIEYFKQSKDLAEANNLPEVAAKNVKALSEIYRESNNNEKADAFEQMLVSSGFSGIDVDEPLSEKQAVSETNQSNDVIKLLTEEVLRQKQLVELEAEKRAKENKINSLKLQNKNDQIQKQRTVVMSLGIVILLILAVLVLLRVQVIQKKKANEELTRKNELISKQSKLITDNIKAASFIQRAAMPPDEYIISEIPEYFILNKPKDIVSGDFYWMEKRGGNLFLAVADCTGHGVQGALISMLGVAILNEIVNKSYKDGPGEILSQLSEKVKKVLHQSGGDSMEDIREGMDMVLLKINKEEKLIEFAGAKNPVYIVHEGDITIYKGDKSPIGYFSKGTPFTTQSIQIENGDSMYMFSDGYADQLGGDEMKKFLSKRFKKLLIDIEPLPMEQRKEKMLQNYNDWKGNYSQVDDVMVMGIKF